MEFYKHTFELNPVGLIIFDLKGIVKEINQSAIDILREDKNSILGAKIEDLLPSIKAEVGTSIVEKKQYGGSPSLIEVDTKNIESDGRSLILASLKDITDETKSRKLLELTQEISKIGSWYLDTVTDKLSWSKMTYKIHELDEKTNVKIEDGINFYAEEHRATISKCVSNCIENGEGWDEELQIITESGKRKWVRAIGNRVIENGKLIGLEGTFQDIDDRKLAEIKNQKTLKQLEEANRKLKQNKNLQDLILKTIPDFVFVKDLEYKIILANDNFLKLYPEEQRDKVIGYTTLESYKDEEKEEFLTKDKQAFDEGYSEAYEKITFPDGKDRVLYTQKIRFNEEEPYILGIARNVTMQLEEEAFLKSLYEMSSNTSLDFERKVDKVLQSACSFFDLNQGIVSEIKQNDYLVLNYFSKKKKEIAEKRFKLNETYCEYTFKSDGVQAYDDASKSRMLNHPAFENMKLHTYIGTTYYVNGEAWGTVNFTRKEPRKRAFNEKEKSYLKLLAEWIGFEFSRTKAIKELENTTLQLVRSNEELAQFAYRTSHDLKAPLTTIKGLTHCIDEDLADGDYVEVEKNLAKIRSQSNRLEKLVVDILSLSKADLVHESYEPVKIFDLVSEIIESQSFTLDHFKVNCEIEIERDLLVRTQRSRITQILSNLINNSIKYSSDTKKEKWVRIKAFVEDEILSIEIEDNGKGIPKDKQQDVFKMFSRFHPDSVEGSGLGMAIVKKNVLALQGDIEFQSNEKGTCFHLKIPLKDNK